jgi:hypothetical protein
LFTDRLVAEQSGISETEVSDSFAAEENCRLGTMWAMKWINEYARDSGREFRDSDEGPLFELIAFAGTYQVWVDALWYAEHGPCELIVDMASRRITCFEGPDLTGRDSDVVQRARLKAPLTAQTVLTEDTDQLTRNWTAGDYRQTLKNLADGVASTGSRIFLPEWHARREGARDSIPRPTLVELSDLDMSIFKEFVINDLVFPEITDEYNKFRFSCLMDTPIIKLRGKWVTLAQDILALARVDDYMLRLAALRDNTQYRIASTLREARMIQRCAIALEAPANGWRVRERVRFSNPDGEIDIVATRGSSCIVLELKSTLRPQSPSEVRKRNADLLKGIDQAVQAREFTGAQIAFVVTDGYPGDYECWHKADSRGVILATLDEIDQIALDPVAAAFRIRASAGMNGPRSVGKLSENERECELIGWTLRLVDSAAP